MKTKIDRLLANIKVSPKIVRLYIIWLLVAGLIMLASLAVFAQETPVVKAFQACEGDKKTALVAGGITGCAFGIVGGVAGCTVGALGFTVVAKEGFSIERCMDSKL